MEPIDNRQRLLMIEQTAYFLAEQRNFAPGHEMEDWLAAERKVDDWLRRMEVPVGAPQQEVAPNSRRGRKPATTAETVVPAPETAAAEAPVKRRGRKPAAEKTAAQLSPDTAVSDAPAPDASARRRIVHETGTAPFAAPGAETPRRARPAAGSAEAGASLQTAETAPRRRGRKPRTGA